MSEAMEKLYLKYHNLKDEHAVAKERINKLEELLDIADEHGIISEDGKTWRETLNDRHFPHAVSDVSGFGDLAGLSRHEDESDDDFRKRILNKFRGGENGA